MGSDIEAEQLHGIVLLPSYRICRMNGCP